VEEEADPTPEEAPGSWSEEQLRDFARELAVRRRRQLRSGQLFAGVLITLVAGGVLFRVDPAYWIPAVGVVALGALLFRLTNWKCPNCGEGLPTRRSRPTCLGCGLPLE
jgi:hypothetical protein